MRGLLIAAAAVGLAAAGRADDKAAAKGKETLELAGMTAVVPAEWKKEKPASAMRAAQFKLPRADKDKEDAELAVFVFPGGAGSAKDNLARQTAKFVAEGRTDKESKIKVGGIEATYQDVAGTFKKKASMMATDFSPVKEYRQLYVLFEADDKRQYYMTLLGPKATVEKHKKAFEQFLASFK